MLIKPLFAGGKTVIDSFRVSLIQLDSSKAGNYSAMLEAALTAKIAGAELIVFPESSVFGWLNPKVFTDAEPIPGATSDKFSSIAKQAGIWIAVGLAEKGPTIKNHYSYAYDSGILVNPNGDIVIHHRKNSVIKNAFKPEDCPPFLNEKGCSYSAGSTVSVVDTPFGKTTLLVCADAYTYDVTTLDKVKLLKPDLVIVPWGIAAAKQEECGKQGFNATGYAAQTAKYLGTSYVIGANARGERPYGRFLPSVYCGNSGYATPSGEIGGVANSNDEIVYFDVPRKVQP